MLPSWIRSSSETPLPAYFFAMETTSLRFALVRWALARLSPRSMRRARYVSWALVRGSLADLVQVHLDRVPRVAALQVAFEHLFDELGVLVFAHRLREESGVDHLDAVLAEETVDLLDLVGGEVDLL